MPALAITLNQLAAAILGAGAYIYHISQRSGWKACAIVCGCRIERSSPDPYCAIAQVAQVLIDYEAVQAAEDWISTPEARAAYRAAWAASEGQPVPTRFAAAEAAAAATEAAGWPSTIRTQHDNARTMQRLRSITGRDSAAPVAAAATMLAADGCKVCGGSGRVPAGPPAEEWETDFCVSCHPQLSDFNDESGRDYEEELAGDYYSQAD